MKNALTLTELRKLAEQLPATAENGREYAVMRRPSSIAVYDFAYQATMIDTVIETVRFHAEKSAVDGAPVTAWYYRDILVRVTV